MFEMNPRTLVQFKYYMPPLVTQKCQFETDEHESNKQGSHGYITGAQSILLVFARLNCQP